MTNPTYFHALDYERMVREYPIGDEFAALMKSMSRDELHAVQEKRLLKLIDRGWEVPFYKRLWSAAGMAPGDIKTLGDSAKIPSYSKADLMKSIEEYPPFGDFHGMETYDKDKRPPVVFHTTSGTTGTPQNLFFDDGNELIAALMSTAEKLRLAGSNTPTFCALYGASTTSPLLASATPS